MLALTSRRLRGTARRVFGWERLRPAQLAAMKAVMKHRDVIAVMPTGAGKSAVYQVPAVLLGGPVVVVSPLIALQRDQMQGLMESGGLRAEAVNSAQRRSANDTAWDRISAGSVDVVFLAPEQLVKDDVLARLAAIRPRLLVVDEAHCVSSWGHDFRPDYLRLRHAREGLGNPPVLALTANAAAPVRRDIAERLGMTAPVEVVSGFDRPGIHLEVRAFQDEAAKNRFVIERAAVEEKPGIVYASTRRAADTIARELADLGLAADSYHAGRSSAERGTVQDRFVGGESDVIVATSAFGMGIDKANVRFVLHASVPGSLDAYYQEFGRAGRDGAPARAILAYRAKDLGLQRYFAAGAPDADALRRVAQRLCDEDGSIGATRLRSDCGLSATRLSAVLNLLEEAGAVRTGRRGSRWTGPEGGAGGRAATDNDPRAGSSSVPDGPGDLDPVEAAVQHALAVDATHRKLEQSRVDMMRGYAETLDCRRRFLLGYFGESVAVPCGACDNCAATSGAATVPGSATSSDARASEATGTAAAGTAAPAVPAGRDGVAGQEPAAPTRRRRLPFPGQRRAPGGGILGRRAGTRPAAEPATRANRRGTPERATHPYLPGVRVRHGHWGDGEVMSEGDGKVTVLFESVGYRTLSLSVVTDKDLLTTAPDDRS